MMAKSGTDLSPLASVWEKSQNVVIFIHPQATYDAVAAATAMQEAIRQTEGKNCVVACEAPMRPEYNRLAGIDQVQQEVGNRDLVISFDYSQEQVDKVNYNVDEENNRFELIITPQSGHKSVDPKTVEFRQAGLSADIVLLFGFHSFQEMGRYYEQEKYTIDSAFTVAITQSQVPTFAKLHVALQADQLSYSEWAYFALRQVQMGKPTDQVATNILAGIDYATDRLRLNQNPRTFETVAQLMRKNGQRLVDNPALDYPATPIREPQSPASVQPSGWQRPENIQLPDSNMPPADVIKTSRS